MAKTGLSEKELRELKDQALEEHRGRKLKVPYETGELRKLQKKEAAKAFVRLSHVAQSVALRKSNFTAWQDLNRWIYMIYHGTPKMAIEGEVKVPIQVTFTLASPVKELEQPKRLKEGEIERNIEDKPSIITSTAEAD